MAKQFNQEYSIRQLAKARELSAESVDPNPIFMPVGRVRPETFNQALERIMSASISSGMTFQEAFDQLRPSYDYDGDFSESFDVDDDDEFEQSEFAEYEPEYTPEGDSSHPLSSNYEPDSSPTPHKADEKSAGGESASADVAEIDT